MRFTFLIPLLSAAWLRYTRSVPCFSSTLTAFLWILSRRLLGLRLCALPLDSSRRSLTSEGVDTVSRGVYSPFRFDSTGETCEATVHEETQKETYTQVVEDGWLMEELESLDTQACEYNQSKEFLNYVRSWQFRCHHRGDDLLPAIAKAMRSSSK